MGSSRGIQDFKKLSKGLIPHRDNSTRWNSWYNIIDWALRKIKQAIIIYSSDESELADNILTASDWRIINTICSFLRNFHDATKATEGRRAILDMVLPMMDFLIECFETEIVQYKHDPNMHASLHTGLSKLLKYWNKTERAPAHVAAIVLNPYYKLHYFRDWKPEWQPRIREILKNF